MRASRTRQARPRGFAVRAGPTRLAILQSTTMRTDPPAHARQPRNKFTTSPSAPQESRNASVHGHRRIDVYIFRNSSSGRSLEALKHRLKD
eukprot:377444-Amphidinium_carterae.1